MCSRDGLWNTLLVNLVAFNSSRDSSFPIFTQDDRPAAGAILYERVERIVQRAGLQLRRARGCHLCESQRGWWIWWMMRWHLWYRFLDSRYTSILRAMPFVSTHTLICDHGFPPNCYCHTWYFLISPFVSICVGARWWPPPFFLDASWYILFVFICIAWTMPTKLLSTFVTQAPLDSSELERVQVQENTNVSSPTKQMAFVKRNNLMDQWRNAGYSLCRIQSFWPSVDPEEVKRLIDPIWLEIVVPKSHGLSPFSQPKIGAAPFSDNPMEFFVSCSLLYIHVYPTVSRLWYVQPWGVGDKILEASLGALWMGGTYVDDSK